MIVNIPNYEITVLRALCENIEPILPSIYRGQICDFYAQIQSGMINYEFLSNVLSIVGSIIEDYENKNHNLIVDNSTMNHNKMKQQFDKLYDMIRLLHQLIENATVEQNSIQKSMRR